MPFQTFPKNLTRTICTTLVAMLVFAPASRILAAPGATNAAVSALSVTSDPEGAAVYVDGKLAGHTPVTLDAVALGEHRVRVVKRGFLENSRVVGVRSDRPNALAVKLTKYAGGSSTESVAPGDKSKKWLWIGLGAVAVTGAVLLLRPKNAAPTVTGVSASASTGLAAATNITFTASASDSDGDSLTYTWNFGDGSTATTQTGSTSHVYASAGSNTVTVSVSDGTKSATSSTTVTIRSMTGTWRGSLFNSTVTFIQSGTTLTGTYADVDGGGTVTLGLVSPSAPMVRFTVTQPQISFTAAFTGNPDANVNIITGTFGGIAMTLTRQ